jgi:hypothetical protein
MRRLCLVAAGTLILSTLLSTYSQSPAPSPQTRETLTRNDQSQPAKAKKVLVKGLPKKVEGIVLEKGVFRIKPGYKFIPQTDNTVAVGLKIGGRLTGNFDCSCSKDRAGWCSITTSGGSLSCVKSKTYPCSGECQLTTTINGTATRLAIF